MAQNASSVGIKRIVLLIVAATIAMGLPIGSAHASDPQNCNMADNGNFGNLVSPNGAVKMAVLFADFTDARSTASTAPYDDVFNQASGWLSTSSYGKLDLQVAPLDQWVHLPGPQSDYINDRLKFAGDAIAQADPLFDFSGVDIVSVVAAPEADKFTYSSYWSQGKAIQPDGASIRTGAFFGSNLLPGGKLTAVQQIIPSFVRYSSTASVWDVMAYGSNSLAPDLFAWEKWHIGWLDNSQIDCITEQGTTQASLTPLEVAGGTKAVIIRTSNHVEYVAENRQKTGLDASSCEDGVLVYKVDLDNPSQLIEVKPARPDEHPSPCGNTSIDPVLYNAPFDIGSGQVSTFHDADAGVTIDITALNNGVYDLTITDDHSLDLPDQHVTRAVTGSHFTGVPRFRHVGTKVRVTGGVSFVSNPYAKCALGVPVALQRQKGTAWVTVAHSMTTSDGGTFTLSAPAKRGKYKVSAPQLIVGTAPRYICEAASSAPTKFAP